ncbi:cysteine-rich receptor-like protein kinase 15 [Rhodamnia argentea]|uniref:Cysteine-rich receptor-like protein kinase 15 n=1 Tax=Rhodamnia argentea TaxID=178133 RepID=A0ABM3H6J1_9MYRT|nr:cysteine-rich receptor-like protein kinase 15 [Rhodamnia argentea]
MITLFRPRGVSRTILLLLFRCLLPGFRDPVLADLPETLCPDNGSYATNSAYQDNLNELTSSMQKNAAFSKFFEDSSGNYPNKVYGQYMCLDYVSNSTCRTCIAKGSEDLLKLCPNKTEAVVWEEFCQLRISSQEFFGRLTEVNKNQFNPENISDPGKFGLVVNETLSFLAWKAALDSPGTHYATKEKNFKLGTNMTLYALAQCAKDLTADDCRKCLQEAIRNVTDCCYFSKGARVLSPSCYLRYELYDFTLPENQKKKAGKQWLIEVLAILSLCLAATSLCSWIFFGIIKSNNLYPNGDLCALPEFQYTRDSSFFIPGKKDLADRQGRPLLTGDSAHGILPFRYTRGNTLTEIQDHPYFDMRCILAATDNFSDTLKLGQGGFGPVYKGILPDGRVVAVKRLESWSEKGSEEFRNEVLLIMKLQHKNLIPVLLCVLHNMRNIIFIRHLVTSFFGIDAQRRIELSWGRRLNIIIGIARGMLYLHEDSRQKIIFRDLKASNVLLDRFMNPKISDFGLARIFAGTENEANTATLVGTYGYMAPEYAMEGLYSIKSDVYSFGVLLLEIITGERNAGFWQSRRAPSLLAYAWQLWNEGRAMELMDPLLHNKCCPEELMKCVHVGLLCVQEDAFDRPTMSAVNVMLKRDAVILRQPLKPAFSASRFTHQSKGGVDDDDCSVNGLTVSTVAPR